MSENNRIRRGNDAWLRRFGADLYYDCSQMSKAIQNGEWISTASASPSERQDACRRAADALLAGRPVVLPTETVYGAFVRADSAEALRAFADLTGEATGAWHAPHAEAVIHAAAPVSPLHAHMIHRLTPGPVTFLWSLDGKRKAQITQAIGFQPSVLEHTEALAVRIPDHSLSLAVLAAAWEHADGSSRVPMIARAWDRTKRDSRIAVGLDDGPALHGQPSTQVFLSGDRGWKVVSDGVLPEWVIANAAERSILFVCTGNTCRSPMAQAIATHFLRASHSAIPTRATSAGVFASSGSPMTPEAAEALQSLGIQPHAHRSQALTVDMIRRADAIYTMTDSHRQRVLEMAPYAADKIKTILPGQDVEDPIGGPLVLYVKTARTLQGAIERRLAELDQQDSPRVSSGD